MSLHRLFPMHNLPHKSPFMNKHSPLTQTEWVLQRLDYCNTKIQVSFFSQTINISVGMQTSPFNCWFPSAALQLFPYLLLKRLHMWGFFPRVFWSWMAEYWAHWCTEKQGQNPAIFRGQHGGGFVARLVCFSVLNCLSREGFRSHTGAAADLRTSLPDKGINVLYHSCRWMQSTVALHRHSLLLLCSR